MGVGAGSSGHVITVDRRHLATECVIQMIDDHQFPALPDIVYNTRQFLRFISAATSATTCWIVESAKKKKKHMLCECVGETKDVNARIWRDVLTIEPILAIVTPSSFLPTKEYRAYRLT